ncbi:MAG: NAD-dependent deacylase [Thermodesulfobacteriota bacterium]
MEHQLIERAAVDIIHSKRTIAFTGAGISVESGIPDFRGAQGLWQKYDPEEYAHIHAFYSNPDRVWLMLKEMFSLIMIAKPNPAHIGLAKLERMGLLSSVVTQNVDGLHQAAGSQNVIEFHGTHRTLSCLKCSTKIEGSSLTLEDLPPRCSHCSSLLKPDVVFFGEPIPWEAQVMSFKESKSCSAVLVIGTSAVVYPAATIPITAKEGGAVVIEINMEPTPLTDQISDYLILGSASEIVAAIVEEVKRRSPLHSPLSPGGREQR